MSSISFEFNAKKALEAILYIANRVQNPDRIRILKLLYLADKTSLERWGRFISGDTYYAMQHGPVPSSSYDLIKGSLMDTEQDFRQVGYEIKPLRNADIDELSESDTECLDTVIDAYGKLPTWQLRDITHDQAYNAVWEAAGERGSTLIPVESIIEEFDLAEDLLDYLHNAHAD